MSAVSGLQGEISGIGTGGYFIFFHSPIYLWLPDNIWNMSEHLMNVCNLFLYSLDGAFHFVDGFFLSFFIFLFFIFLNWRRGIGFDGYGGISF